MRAICIIPARGGSKGIPGKNIVEFCGKPLIVWSIEQALASRYIGDVYVSSDNRDILEVCKGTGAKTITRPDHLARDDSPTEDTLVHAIGEIEKREGRKVDIIIFLQATSPVRTPEDIDAAIDTFMSQKADSLFSAALLDDFCAWRVKKSRYVSATFDYKNRGQRQTREPHYLENGSIYIFRKEILKKHKNRLGGKIATYLMPLWRSFEIDKIEDLELCEYYMRTKILDIRNRKYHIPINNVKLIIYDFDGVLTDNKVIVREDGLESAVVNRSDGLAISMIKKMGIKQMILTSETNRVVKARAAKLRIPIIMGANDKKDIIGKYCRRNKIPLQGVLYIGNDINDLEVMKMVGYPICPSDASSDIRDISKIVLNKKGGEGIAMELFRYLYRG